MIDWSGMVGVEPDPEDLIEVPDELDADEEEDA